MSATRIKEIKDLPKIETLKKLSTERLLTFFKKHKSSLKYLANEYDNNGEQDKQKEIVDYLKSINEELSTREHIKK